MDQKRAWQKAVGKKRYLRILAAILSFCVLLTSLPSLPAALTVFAASEETDILPNNEKIPGGGERYRLRYPFYEAGRSRRIWGDR